MPYKAKMLTKLLYLKVKNREQEKLYDELIGKIAAAELKDISGILCEIYEKINDQGIISRLIPSRRDFEVDGNFMYLDDIERYKIIWIANISGYLFELTFQEIDKLNEFKSLVQSICRLSKDNILNGLYEILAKLYDIFHGNEDEIEKIVKKSHIENLLDMFY